MLRQRWLRALEPPTSKSPHPPPARQPFDFLYLGSHEDEAQVDTLGDSGFGDIRTDKLRRKREKDTAMARWCALLALAQLVVLSVLLFIFFISSSSNQFLAHNGNAPGVSSSTNSRVTAGLSFVQALHQLQTEQNDGSKSPPVVHTHPKGKTNPNQRSSYSKRFLDAKLKINQEVDIYGHMCQGTLLDVATTPSGQTVFLVSFAGWANEASTWILEDLLTPSVRSNRDFCDTPGTQLRLPYFKDSRWMQCSLALHRACSSFDCFSGLPASMSDGFFMPRTFYDVQDEIAQTTGECPFSDEVHWKPDRFIFPDCTNAIRNRAKAEPFEPDSESSLAFLRKLQSNSSPMCPAPAQFLWQALEITYEDCHRWVRVKCNKRSSCSSASTGSWANDVFRQNFVEAQRWAAERSRCPHEAVMQWVPFKTFYPECAPLLSRICSIENTHAKAYTPMDIFHGCPSLDSFVQAQTIATEKGTEACPKPEEFLFLNT